MTCVLSIEPLPSFRYYRDPVAEGTLEPSGVMCAACERRRGFIVTSTAYGTDVLKDAQFYPWCVADATAHERYGVTLNEVEAGATAEVCVRTPGFLSWQNCAWPTHCNDVGVHLGQPTAGELRGNREAYVRDFIDGLGRKPRRISVPVPAMR